MMHLNYQQQQSTQTLQQGLDEYYQAFPGLVTSADARPEVAQLFQCHDVIHVMFGCDTSLTQEVYADTWTLFGSTVSWRDYLAYLQYPETRQLMAEIGWGRSLWATLRAIPGVLRVIARTRQMSQPWPWQEYQNYLGRSLQEIRQTFKIQVLVPTPVNLHHLNLSSPQP